MGIIESTVKNRIGKILKKTGFKTAAQLAACVVSNGFIPREAN